MASCSIEYAWSLIPLDVFEVIQSVMRSFRTGAGLTNGQPTKFSCQSARYSSRSLAFTYSQYAFSNSQTCASSFAEVCPKAVALNARNKLMVRNMCRSYLTNQESGKVPTQIMVTWRITDKTGTRDTRSKRAPLNARAECVYCARNAVIGSTFVARSAGT